MESRFRKNAYEPVQQLIDRNGLIVESVEEGSVGEELGIQAGDSIRTVDGYRVTDELDWIYRTAGENYLVELEKPSGEIWEIEAELDDEESMGLTFVSTLAAKRCKNNCLFCFIDQNPPGMRETIYVKDDDERLSFLNGNYITLTNLKQSEIDRIKAWRIPVNISVHATDPQVRVRLLGNRFAGPILEQMRELSEAGVEMNAQIVLVPGINDEEILEKTLYDLKGLYPALRSISVVPIGLTKYREGLAPLRGFTKEEAKKTLDRITRFQEEMLDLHASRFVFPSDELFILAEEEIPSSAYYEGFAQLENGVGMIASFLEEAEAFDQEADPALALQDDILFATGTLATPVLKAAAERAAAHRSGHIPEIIPLTNHFYGQTVTVSGLLTGKDIIRQLNPFVKKGKKRILYLPENMIKNDTDLFLDDVRIQEIENALELNVEILPADGTHFMKALLGELDS